MQIIQTISASVGVLVVLIGIVVWVGKARLRAFVEDLIETHFEEHVAPTWERIAGQLDNMSREIKGLAIRDAYMRGVAEGQRRERARGDNE